MLLCKDERGDSDLEEEQKKMWFFENITSPYCSFSLVLGLIHLDLVAVLFSRLAKNSEAVGTTEGIIGSFLLLFSVVGLVFGLVGVFKRKEKGRGFGVAGLILNGLMLLGMIALIMIGR